MTEELKPCPICGDEPVRNGRGVVGGVLCAGAGSHPHMGHRVQAYGGSQAEADAAWNTRLSHSAEKEALIEALEPVKHWYQSDEHEDRPLAAIVADLVADLQHDRPLALQAEKLREALNDLVSWFPEKPTDPEWRLRGGEWGADDAVAHARSTLLSMRNNGNG